MPQRLRTRNNAGDLLVWREGNLVVLRQEIGGQQQGHGLSIAPNFLAQLATHNVVETSGLPLLRQYQHPAGAWGDVVYVMFSRGRFVVVDTAALARATNIRL